MFVNVNMINKIITKLLCLIILTSSISYAADNFSSAPDQLGVKVPTDFLGVLERLDDFIFYVIGHRKNLINIDNFLGNLEKISQAYYPELSDFEKGNWRILLNDERKACEPEGFTCQSTIKRFFIRHSKWPFTVVNIRKLVLDCGKAYHGLITRQQAEKLFKDLDEKNTYALVRALEISNEFKEPMAVFAVSYRLKQGEYLNREIEHLCIYNNGSQLCLINDSNKYEFYDNMQDIFKRIFADEKLCFIKSKQFANFLPQFKKTFRPDNQEEFFVIKKLKLNKE